MNNLLLIPLFYSTSTSRMAEGYTGYFKLAYHALQTWKRNTDASEHNVRCAIYIEDRLIDEAPDYYQDLTESDIITWHGGDNSGWGRFTKCLAPLLDRRLANYERVSIADADLFVPRKETIVPIFEALNAYDNETFVVKRISENFPNGMTLYEYIEHDNGTPPGITGGQATNQMVQAYRDLTGNADFEFTPPFLSVNTSFMSIPQQHYYKNHPDLIAWFKYIGKQYGNDETVLTFFDNLFGIKTDFMATTRNHSAGTKNTEKGIKDTDFLSNPLSSVYWLTSKDVEAIKNLL